jgi:hypothetical protein
MKCIGLALAYELNEISFTVKIYVALTFESDRW